MIRVLLLALFLISCKKEEVKVQEVSNPKTFSAKVSGAQLFEIKKNGSILSPPFTVLPGDVVYVNCRAQASTPPSYNMTVFFYLDGFNLGGCANCNSYENTFNVQ